MTQNETAMPRVTTHEEWLAARKTLLEHEKEATRQRDRLAAERRRLPMVPVEKEYVFEGPEGKRSLRDLFEGKRQLLVYHFMFDPDWDEGCPGCTWYIDALGDRTPLGERDARFVVISRARLAKLEAYKARRGWDIPWYSSYGSDFNYDFHVTHDERIRPIEYNYRDKAELEKRGQLSSKPGEAPGLSVFFRDGDAVYHTYSAYARGVESLTDSSSLLDVTPYGRQEDWEDSPAGWPQRPTYG